MSYRRTVLYTTTAMYFENASNIKKEINAPKRYIITLGPCSWVGENFKNPVERVLYQSSKFVNSRVIGIGFLCVPQLHDAERAY